MCLQVLALEGTRGIGPLRRTEDLEFEDAQRDSMTSVVEGRGDEEGLR